METRSLSSRIEKYFSDVSKFDVAFMATLVIAAAALRIMPHLPNFAPITALAIFGAYKLRSGGFIIPIAAIVASDLIIGTHDMVAWTWGSFALIALMSQLFVKSNYTAHRLVYASLSGSIAFYLITNYGVWAQNWLYPMTVEGLALSYYNGLPFLRSTLLGDLFYTATIFSAYHILSHLITSGILLKSNRSMASA